MSRVQTPADMEIGVIHSSNSFGDFEVVKYADCSNVAIRFLDTGYKVVASAGHIRRGSVRDKMRPVLCGVGFIGSGAYKSIAGDSNWKRSAQYVMWSGMINRCYDPKTQEKQPTYAGCTVAPVWHNFQNFCAWLEAENFTGQKGYDLDKDIKVKGNKVYGPDTCTLVSHADNIVASLARHYTFINPAGQLIKVYNLSEFCRDNALNRAHMSSVHSGRIPHHKKWTAAPQKGAA